MLKDGFAGCTPAVRHCRGRQRFPVGADSISARGGSRRRALSSGRGPGMPAPTVMLQFFALRTKKSQRVEKGVLPPWPPLRGGSARRRWGRELYDHPKYFGLWQGSLPPPLRGTSLAEGGFSTVCDFFALRTKKSPTVRSRERWGQNAISRPLKRRRAKRQNGGAACYWQEPHRRGKQPVDGSRLVMVSRR